MKCRIALNHLPYGFIPFFMKQTIFNLSLLIQHACYSQTCDCSAAISIVQEKVESNLASYQHQVVEFKRENAYARHKLNIFSSVIPMMPCPSVQLQILQQ